MFKKIAIVLLTSAALVLGFGVQAHATTPVPRQPRDTVAVPVNVAYAGDSTTAQTNSWLCHIHAPDFNVVGGFAKSGYRTDQVLAAITPQPTADVVVIMLGINDIHAPGYSDLPGIIDRINQIAVKVDAQHVILSATAPSNITSYTRSDGTVVDPQKVQTQLNALIKSDALTMGYTYKDPFSSIRSSVTGGYHAADETADGVHPSTAGYVIVAQELAPVIQAVAVS